MIETTATIQNAHGIHCRPSSIIVKYAIQYDGDILITNGKKKSNLRSILELIALELLQGTTVTIQVDGPNEQQTSCDLVALFEKHFDFPQEGQKE